MVQFKSESPAHFHRNTHIREILADCLKKQQKTGAANSRTKELLSLLNWLNELSILAVSQHSGLKRFEVWLKRTSANLLLSELQRLNEGKTGEWKRDTRKRSSILLQHSSFPSIGLQVGLASGLVATAQIRRSDLTKKASQEKILLPLGAHADQVLNLVDIAARDICNVFFQQKDKYVADKRRRKHRAIDPDVSKELGIIYRYRYELPILLKLISLGS